MADTFTRVGFTIPAVRLDAERFIMLIDALATLAESGAATLPPEIEQAFASATASGASNLAALFANEVSFGMDCLFDARTKTLSIFDQEGSPALWPLAQCLQQLFPEKLPLGFVYANTNAEGMRRAGGSAGGIFAINRDTIIHKTFDQVLDAEINDLKGIADVG